MPDNRIRRALISVWDKTGVVEFARALHDEFGVEILSTGGTARTLRDAGIPVALIEDITGFPELLDGRVKTLHPKIHAAILADRDNPEHMRQLAEQGIQPIDLVVVNLYPFEKTVADPNCTLEQAIEMIDIGGVALLRAAAKNREHVFTIWRPDDYAPSLALLRQGIRLGIPLKEAAFAGFGPFLFTSQYDASISEWMGRVGASWPQPHTGCWSDWGPLRYGENPHQSSSLLGSNPSGGLDLVLSGDPCGKVDEQGRMSYNNYLDADAALGLCAELSRARQEEPRASARAVSPIQEEPRASARAVSPIQEEPRASARAVSPIQEEPRASARAVSDRCAISIPPANDSVVPSSSPGRAALQAILQPPDPQSSTWLLTWSTYGTWLPGDARGFVSRSPQPDGTHLVHNLPGELFDADQADLRESARERMHGSAVYLQHEHVDPLLGSFGEVSASHGIGLLAVAVMTDHVHLLCQSDRDGAELIQLFKGVSSRRLSQSCRRVDAPRWWTKSGSRRHIRAGVELQAAVDYLEQQQSPLAVLSYRLTAELGAKSGMAGALGTARAEARGSSVAQDTARAEARGSSVAPGTARAEARGSSVAPDTARAEARGSSVAPDAARAEARGSFWGCVCVFIKHTNPCGVGIATAANRSEEAALAAQVEAYRRAYLGDPNAAMGGVLACNFVVDGEFALEVMSTYERLGKPLREQGAPYAPGGFFVEVWLAPRFTHTALAVIRGDTGQLPATLAGATRKKWGPSVRLLPVGDLSAPPDQDAMHYRSIAGGMLVQAPDRHGLNESDWKVVTRRAPTEAEWADLRLAWLVCKHTKSNAISICKDGVLLGNGAGQMSRVMSCRIATWLARENGHAEALHGAAAASDAFFPFQDGPAILLDAGVTALIQPGGSKRDDETIALCDERNAAMVLTGTRHFRH